MVVQDYCDCQNNDVSVLLYIKMYPLYRRFIVERSMEIFFFFVVFCMPLAELRRFSFALIIGRTDAWKTSMETVMLSMIYSLATG